MAFKSISTLLQLSDKQGPLKAKHAGCSRWVYNWGLALWKCRDATCRVSTTGLKPNVGAVKKVFPCVTLPQYPWMALLSDKVYQYAFLDQGEAFKRFFTG